MLIWRQPRGIGSDERLLLPRGLKNGESASLQKVRVVVDATIRRWKRFACYIPLVALTVEFVWIVLLFMALVFAVGDTPYVNTPAKSHFFSLLSAVPAAAGFLIGLVAILLRLPVHLVDWIFLIAGSALCAILVCLCTTGLW